MKICVCVFGFKIKEKEKRINIFFFNYRLLDICMVLKSKLGVYI